MTNCENKSTFPNKEEEKKSKTQLKSGTETETDTDTDTETYTESDSDNEILDRNLHFCEICNGNDDITKIPSVYCKECDHYYCEHHNQIIHSSKEKQKHLRKRIGGVITIKDIIRFHAYANIFLKKFYPEYFKEEEKNTFKTIYKVNNLINKKVALLMGNSASLAIDAVQNSANIGLLHGGGGINSLIHKVGGIKLTQECKKLSPVQSGNTVLTKAYNLPSKYVLHTVGPSNKDPDLLRKAYKSLFQIVKEKDDISTVGLCAVAVGTYGFPIDLATNIALEITRDWLEKNSDSIELITFVVNDKRVFDCYQELMIKLYFPVK
ncbi:poly [adp-ribose] polymerase [Anaeramoeba flamelloides]|uniref:Poly [adp-ribose] polymerase n=1 Tax=Anaeramoeba flamelloides TaxID=1746091 RepID=A0ABQ8YJ35_9EUKA|nr:poly [adp-ribose] polymerase [Anaeramoeba flamelloides]